MNRGPCPHSGLGPDGAGNWNTWDTKERNHRVRAADRAWGVGWGLFLAGMGNSYWKRLQAQKAPSGLPSFCAQSLVPDIKSVWI